MVSAMAHYQGSCLSLTSIVLYHSPAELLGNDVSDLTSLVGMNDNVIVKLIILTNVKSTRKQLNFRQQRLTFPACPPKRSRPLPAICPEMRGQNYALEARA